MPSLPLLAATLAGFLDAIPPQAVAQVDDKNAWCAPGIESLPNDVCYLNGTGEDTSMDRRTLVIFLHGAVAKNTTWQWNHMRGMLPLAKGDKIEILFPRSPKSDVGFVWPGSVASQEKVEEDLAAQWMNAKRILEDRRHRKFDEVFVMGFSSGAYFTSSLAMRGRLDVDGYAVFAGGQPGVAPAKPIEHFAPVFVGICSKDETTAAHSRAFAGSLSAAGIPRLAVEQPVGHGLSSVHFNSALRYLRYAHR